MPATRRVTRPKSPTYLPANSFHRGYITQNLNKLQLIQTAAGPTGENTSNCCQKAASPFTTYFKILIIYLEELCQRGFYIYINNCFYNILLTVASFLLLIACQRLCSLFRRALYE